MIKSHKYDTLDVKIFSTLSYDLGCKVGDEVWSILHYWMVNELVVTLASDIKSKLQGGGF